MTEVLGIRLSGVVAKRGKIPEVVLYESMDIAVNSGNQFRLFSSPDEIAQDVRRMSADEMLETYNSIMPSVYRWKSTDDFSTRIEGAIAIWNAALKRLPIQKAVGGTYGQTEKEEIMPKKKEAEVVEAKTKKKAKTEANGEKKERAPRSDYSGKRFFAKVKPSECGRREGSDRYNSFVIVHSAGKAGIKYEDYIAKDGNPQVLRWFVKGDQVGVK